MASRREIGGGMFVEVLVNIVLPYLVYSRLEARLGPVHALMASSLPPIAWSLIEFARKRRADALSLLVLAGIGLSLLAFLGGGSVRLLQLREQMVTAAVGIVFLVSAAIGRPLMYLLAIAFMRRQSQQAEADRLESLRDRPGFRHTMIVMTLVWGFGLVIEAALAAVLIFHMSIKTFLVASPIFAYGTIACLSAWTYWYGRHRRNMARAAAT